MLEETTFFILKYGPDHTATLSLWLESKITLTRDERELLCVLLEPDHATVDMDFMLDYKAQFTAGCNDG